MLGADLKQSGGKFARAQAEVFSAAGLKELLKQGLLPSERRGFSGGIHLNKSAKLFWLWMLSQSDTPEPPQVPAVLRGKDASARKNSMQERTRFAFLSCRVNCKEEIAMTRNEFTLAFCSLATAAFALVLVFWQAPAAEAGQVAASSRYQVLSPITEGNLTIFPVVTAATHDTGEFLTLDEGLRSGEVEVMESGQAEGLVRRPGTRPQHYGGAQVNQLVLVNHGKRPLLLLAGEIVTGGKQDRIVGKDRIIPADSDADLSVFCVEPGRWTGTSAKFSTTGAYGDSNLSYMAQPSVRAQAMDKKDQQKVWDEVNKSKREMS